MSGRIPCWSCREAVDGPVSLEKRPLDLLIHLVANADRVISKDEIVEVVWQRRIVSDATIASE